MAVNNDAPFGLHALHRAAIDNNVDILQLLLDHGALTNVRTVKDWTPLHCAARYGHVEIARRLMHAGADSRALNSKGQTPGALAAEWGQRQFL